MTTATPDLAEIQKQLEYYLSTDNLKRDEFFHDLIEKDEEKSIPLDVLLKCNKLKKMNIEKEALLEAVKGSEIVEANSTLSGIKRKGEFDLPELEPKPEKKVKKEGENGTVKNQLAEKKPEEEPFDPVILQFKTENASSKTWKDVQAIANSILGTEIPYTRFNKVEGHLALDKKNLTADAKIKITTDGFEIEGEKFSVKEAEGDDLKAFYDQHGFHFQNIIESTTQKKVKGRDGKKKNNRNDKNKKKTEAVTLGNQKFDEINKVKNVFKSLLQSTADNEEIKEPHHSMLLDLLKYHDNYETKTKDLKHFTAGTHPTYNETRCYFIVRNNGEKEDFSTTKCYNKVQEKIEGGAQ